MLVNYPAFFIKTTDGYSVIFPDLDYLSTYGESIDDAMSMAVDCLAGRLYMLYLENEAFPSPSSLDSLDTIDISYFLDEESDKYFTSYVNVNVLDYAKLYFEKNVKKTLSIPQWLNAAAMAANINFSAVLQEALKEKLKFVNK